MGIISVEFCRSIVFVKDMAAMTAFYRDVLGLTPIPSEYPSEEWSAFDAGPVQFALHRIPDPWNAHVTIENPPAPRQSAPTKLVFVVEDLERSRDRLLAQGIQMSDNKNLNEPGQFVRCDFQDPEGNIFQLTTR